MRIRLAVLALALALPVFAQSPRVEDVVVPRGGGAHLLILAAGNVAGAGGTFFRTEISVINLSGSDTKVAAYWLPFGHPGPGAPKILELNSRTGFFSEDFVGSVLEQSGLGSIELLALDNAGVPDPAILLHATVRIWTPEPNVTNGTMSQSFPAVVQTTASFSSVKTIFGARRDAQFRLNVGVVNPHNATQRFRVTAIPSDSPNDRQTFDLELPPRSMTQVAVPGSAPGPYQITVVNLTDGGSNQSSFQVWASSIDNVTGDAWSYVGFPSS